MSTPLTTGASTALTTVGTETTLETTLTTLFSTTPAHVCVVNVTGEGMVGYVEKDGITGFSDATEAVYAGEMLDAGVILYMDCKQW